MSTLILSISFTTLCILPDWYKLLTFHAAILVLILLHVNLIVHTVKTRKCIKSNKYGIKKYTHKLKSHDTGLLNYYRFYLDISMLLPQHQILSLSRFL